MVLCNVSGVHGDMCVCVCVHIVAQRQCNRVIVVSLTVHQVDYGSVILDQSAV